MAPGCGARVAISVDSGADIYSNMDADEPGWPVALVDSPFDCAFRGIGGFVDPRLPAMASHR